MIYKGIKEITIYGGCMGEVSNYASALGEAAGGLLDDAVFEIVKRTSEKSNFLIDRSGKGKKLKVRDRHGNDFDIDIVVFNKKRKPVILIETKFLRYKKHMRDKGSWICTSHFSLRRTHPTIRLCLSVLAGNWTKGAKGLLESFGEEIIEIPFDAVVSSFKKVGVELRWGEKDRETPKKSWNKFVKLKRKQKEQIKNDMIKNYKEKIEKATASVLADKIKEIKLKSLELFVELDSGEQHLKEFKDINELMEFLKKFDIKKLRESKEKDITNFI